MDTNRHACMLPLQPRSITVWYQFQGCPSKQTTAAAPGPTGCRPWPYMMSLQTSDALTFLVPKLGPAISRLINSFRESILRIRSSPVSKSDSWLQTFATLPSSEGWPGIRSEKMVWILKVGSILKPSLIQMISCIDRSLFLPKRFHIKIVCPINQALLSIHCLVFSNPTTLHPQWPPQNFRADLRTWQHRTWLHHETGVQTTRNSLNWTKGPRAKSMETHIKQHGILQPNLHTTFSPSSHLRFAMKHRDKKQGTTERSISMIKVSPADMLSSIKCPLPSAGSVTCNTVRSGVSNIALPKCYSNICEWYI